MFHISRRINDAAMTIVKEAPADTVVVARIGCVVSLFEGAGVANNSVEVVNSLVVRDVWRLLFVLGQVEIAERERNFCVELLQ